MSVSPENSLQRLVLAAIAGVVATGPMTVAMILLHRRLPPEEREPLPPREITMKLASRAGVEPGLDASQRAATTLLSHFGYGAACGAIYGKTVDPHRSPTRNGALFGLFVWAVSYMGWLPLAGLMKPPGQQPWKRNALMIAAHLVWGVTVGKFLSLLVTESEGSTRQPFSSPAVAETPKRRIAGA